jgi:hypothetical protein
VAGLGGLLLLGQALWSFLNQRPEKQTVKDVQNAEFRFGTAVNRPIALSYTTQRRFTPTTLCSNGNPINAGSATTPVNATVNYSGIGFIVGTTQGVQQDVCSGTNTPNTAIIALRQLLASGPGPVVLELETGRINVTTTTRRTVTDSVFNIRAVSDGVTIRNDLVVEPEFAPGMQPLVRPDDLQPARLAPPAVAPIGPAPALTPAAVPGAVPLPVPAQAPGGAPARAPGVAPGRAPAPAKSPAPATPGQSPGAVPLAPAGPIVVPKPPAVAVTPKEGVVIGGELISGPGQAPPATLTAMAAELGRIERKGEMMLDRTGPLSQIPDVIDALADLVELLDSFDPGGSYSIRPACGTDANGDPLPPIEVPISPGLGLAHAVTARLDAIAELIDHHKQLRQPICKGKPTGQPVTVTFVEADP